MDRLWNGRDIRILGLGKTGETLLRHASSQGGRCTVFDTRTHLDSREWEQRYPEATFHFGPLDANALTGADLILSSPGLSPQLPAIARARAEGIPVVGDIELFGQLAQAPVAAITGSNGKSTVTTLLGEMARAAGWHTAVGGNLGTPALDLLPGPGEPSPALYVIEVSSFQLHYTQSFHPRVSAILNLSPDHLDWHGDYDSYIRDKLRVFRNMGPEDTLVLNGEDTRLLQSAGKPAAGPRVRHFGGIGKPDGWIHDGHLHLQETGPLVAAESLKIRGRHNLENALAAALMARALGIPAGPVRQALQEFPGLPHRLQWVGQVHGTDYYDDSKGTNLGASLRAMAALPGPLVLILGGDAKGADLSPLRAACAGHRGAVLLGRDADHLAAVLEGALPLRHAGRQGMETAVALAAELARPGDQVLLSPACASTDMFQDYQDRGRQFARAVAALGEARHA